MISFNINKEEMINEENENTVVDIIDDQPDNPIVQQNNFMDGPNQHENVFKLNKKN